MTKFLEMAALTTYIQLFCILLIVVSIKADDFERQLAVHVNKQIEFGVSRFQHYQQLEDTFKSSITKSVMRKRPLELTDSPIKVMSKLDDNIIKISTIQLNPPNFEPLTEQMEMVYQKLNATTEELNNMKDDLELLYLENRNMFESLELIIFECEYPGELGSKKQELMDYFEEEGDLIKQVINGKLKNNHLEGRERIKEFNEIQNTAQILLGDWMKNLNSALVPLHKEMVQDFKKTINRCTAVIPKGQSINSRLKSASNEAYAEMVNKMSAVKVQIAEWETMRQINGIVEITDKEELFPEESDKIPSVLPIRRNRQAKIETLTDESEGKIVLLKEQQRNDMNSDIFTQTKMQNDRIIEVKKWLIKY